MTGGSEFVYIIHNVSFNESRAHAPGASLFCDFGSDRLFFLHNNVYTESRFLGGSMGTRPTCNHI